MQRVFSRVRFVLVSKRVGPPNVFKQFFSRTFRTFRRGWRRRVVCGADDGRNFLGAGGESRAYFYIRYIHVCRARPTMRVLFCRFFPFIPRCFSILSVRKKEKKGHKNRTVLRRRRNPSTPYTTCMRRKKKQKKKTEKQLVEKDERRRSATRKGRPHPAGSVRTGVARALVTHPGR